MVRTKLCDPSEPANCLAEESVEQTFGRASDHVASHELAGLLSRLSASFHRGSNATNVATYDGGDQGAANANSLHDLHVGGLGHRIGGFDQADEALRFNQSNGCIHLKNL